MAIPDPATTNWVPIWNPLTEGPTGPIGPTGPTGPQGIPGNAVPHHTTHETGGIDEVLFPSGIKERGRTTPLGNWIIEPYNGADYGVANGSGTWTVEAADVPMNAYTLIGNTLIWTVSLQNTVVTNPGDTSVLRIKLPGSLASSFPSSSFIQKPGFAYDTGPSLLYVLQLNDATGIGVHVGGGPITAGGFHLYFTMIIGL